MEASRRKPSRRKPGQSQPSQGKTSRASQQARTSTAAARRQKPGTGLATCALSITILAMLGYAVVKRQQAYEQTQRLATIDKVLDTVANITANDQRTIRAELTSQQSADLPRVGSLRAWPPLEPVGLDAPAYGQPYPQWVPIGSTAQTEPELEVANIPAVEEMSEVLEELGSYKLSEITDNSDAPSNAIGANDIPQAEMIAASPAVVAEVFQPTPAEPIAESLPEFPGLYPQSNPEPSIEPHPQQVADTLPVVLSLEGANVAELAADSAVVIENKFAQMDDSPVYVEPQWPTTVLAPEEVASMPAPPIPTMPFMFAAPTSELAGDVSILEADQLTEDQTGDYSDEIEDAIFDDIEAQMAHDTPIEELLNDTPTTEQVGKLAAKDVREAFNLGRHGALFAARGQFVAVLRRIALAKDAEESTDRHSVALAAGIRALDEAADFIPRGDALATDLDVLAIAQSHTTPLLKDEEHGRWALPHEAIARYHRYAQHKLAASVSGDQAGSMALHGLGKSYARLATLGEAAEAERTSLTMYRSAVMAHDGNYLAANELGVGLAKAGRYQTAEKALQKAIAGGAKSTVYANLAVVQQKLGQTQLAQASSNRATQLASTEMAAGEFSRERGVKWMEPGAFARISGRDESTSFTEKSGHATERGRSPASPAVSTTADRSPDAAAANDEWAKQASPPTGRPRSAALECTPCSATNAWADP